FLSRVGATMSLSRASGNRKICIPLTPLAKADTVAAWKIRNLALARITRAHSKKRTNGSAPSGLSRLHPPLAVARRIRLRVLRGYRGALGNGARGISMQGLPWQHVADGRHSVPGHPQAVADMVPCDVVHHQSEEWRRRPGLAACVGPGQL